MRNTKHLSPRLIGAAVVAVTVGAVSLPGAAAAAAQPTSPIPICVAAKELVVDVTQDVRNDSYLPARDGRMWANFTYTQRVRIWSVGGQQYCIRKDIEGTWVSIAGPSPGLTGNISGGLTGRFNGTEYLKWTGELSPIRPTSGHL